MTALCGVAVALIGWAAFQAFSMLREEDEAGLSLSESVSGVMESAGLRQRESVAGEVDPEKPGNFMFTADEIRTGMDGAAWNESQQGAFLGQLGSGSSWAEWQLHEAGGTVRSIYPLESDAAHVSESDVWALISKLP